jgi:hypothetical protein
VLIHIAGSLHEHVLALWGIPLGELWDLDELAEKCKERKNWKVFITSAPFNVQGKKALHTLKNI